MRMLLSRMYFGSLAGKIALGAGVLALLIPFVHFFGGAPSLEDLHEVEGKVLEVHVTEGLKGSKTIVLTTALNGGGLENLQYFVNRGDGNGERLGGLAGRQVRALVAAEGQKTIYELEVNGQKYIDYHKRSQELAGNPQTIAIWFTLYLGTFVLLSLKRYGEESRR